MPDSQQQDLPTSEIPLPRAALRTQAAQAPPQSGPGAASRELNPAMFATSDVPNPRSYRDERDSSGRQLWDPAKPRPTRRTTDLKRIHAPWRARYVMAAVAIDLVWGSLAAALWVPWPWALATAVLTVSTVSLVGGYAPTIAGQGTEEARRLIKGGWMLAAAASFVALAVDDLVLRDVVLVALPAVAVSVATAHMALRFAMGALRRRGYAVNRVVVVGYERSIAEFIRAARREPQRGFVVVGACADSTQGSTIEDVPHFGGSDTISAALVASGGDTVVVTAWNDISSEDLRRLGWELEGSRAQLMVAPRLVGVSLPRVQLSTVGGVPLLNVAEPEFRGVRRIARVGLDYLMAVLISVVAIPLMGVIAVAIKFTSPGPVFFRQERVGRYGQTFRMHKFRSMYVDAEERKAALAAQNEGAGPLFKMKDDPRITPLGKVLRAFSLDELPQLIDVLRGKMSLIGPRPPLPEEVEQYPRDARRRLRVSPGLTGLWQVSGRSDLSWDDTVRLDLYYVENWSLLLDLQILLRTVMVVLARKGAY